VGDCQQVHLGVGKHCIGPVGRPSASLSASLQKITRLVCRLGSGPRIVADRADVVFTHARTSDHRTLERPWGPIYKESYDVIYLVIYLVWPHQSC